MGVQVANLILPLVLIPYLTRVLGPAGYGTMAYAAGIALMLSIIADYAFNWTATRQVAAARHEPATVGRLIRCVLLIKTVLMLAVMAFYGALVLVVPGWWDDRWVFIASTAMIVGQVYLPMWALQGLERMVGFAIAFIGWRLASMVVILLLVRSPDDVAYAVLLQGLPLILVVFTGWLTAWAEITAVRGWPKRAEILTQLRDGARIFVAMMTINFYTSIQVVLVGSIGGPVAAAYWGAAERCLAAAKAVISVLFQTALPRVAYLAAHDPDAGLRFLRRALVLGASAGAALSAVMWLGADLGALMLFGPAFGPSADVMRMLAPIPLLIGIGTVTSSLFLFNYGYQSLFTWIVIGASALNLSLFLLLSLVFSVPMAAAGGSVAAEAVVALVSWWKFHRRRKA
jgi:PST family polysaccharide transporter